MGGSALRTGIFVDHCDRHTRAYQHQHQYEACDQQRADRQTTPVNSCAEAKAGRRARGSDSAEDQGVFHDGRGTGNHRFRAAPEHADPRNRGHLRCEAADDQVRCRARFGFRTRSFDRDAATTGSCFVDQCQDQGHWKVRLGVGKHRCSEGDRGAIGKLFRRPLRPGRLRRTRWIRRCRDRRVSPRR